MVSECKSMNFEFSASPTGHPGGKWVVFNDSFGLPGVFLSWGSNQRYRQVSVGVVSVWFP